MDHFELIIVDDGSRDRTAQILAQLQAREPALHLRIVTHATNQGYGAALASDFDAARNELILMLDADGRPEHAVELAQPAVCIVRSRWLRLD